MVDFVDVLRPAITRRKTHLLAAEAVIVVFGYPVGASHVTPGVSRIGSLSIPWYLYIPFMLDL